MLAAGRVVVVGGTATVLASLLVQRAPREEVAGIGLASIMAGMMVVLTGNYLRHAAERAEGRTGHVGPGDVPDGGGQPSSVPTTDTNDTISPG